MRSPQKIVPQAPPFDNSKSAIHPFSAAAAVTNCAPALRYTDTMNVIYVDSLFALSLLTDYLLCLAAARVCGLYLRRGRYLLAALFGAVYAVAVFLPGLGFLALPVMELAAALVMGLIAFGGEERMLRCVGVFLAVSATFGGAVWAIALRRGALPAPDPLLLIGCFLGCYLTLSLIAYTRRTRSERRLARAELRLGQATASFSALVDTGNCLRDPLTGAGVMVASPRALSPLFEDCAGLLSTPDPVELVTAADAVPTLKWRLRLLSCTTVGGGGLLPVFRPDAVTVDGRMRADLLVAISPAAVGEGYEAIV